MKLATVCANLAKGCLMLQVAMRGGAGPTCGSPLSDGD